MGFLDDMKKALVKKPSPDVPTERPMPTKIHGVSERTVELLKKVGQELDKKYLGLVIDATGSRRPTWEKAQQILQNIFDRLSAETGLHIRVIYFGGKDIGDLGWSRDVLGVRRRMAEVTCIAGRTQIAEALTLFIEDKQGYLPENIILIGDAFEEQVDNLKKVLTICRRERIRIFSFFEPGGFTTNIESSAEVIFKKIAKVTNGVYQEYREGVYLDELMVAAAAYAAKGQAGLEKLIKENSRAALTLQRELLQIESKKGELR